MCFIHKYILNSRVQIVQSTVRGNTSHRHTHLTPHRDKATDEQAIVPEDTVVTITLLK